MFRRNEVIWSKFVSLSENLFDPLETKGANIGIKNEIQKKYQVILYFWTCVSTPELLYEQ